MKITIGLENLAEDVAQAIAALQKLQHDTPTTAQVLAGAPAVPASLMVSEAEAPQALQTAMANYAAQMPEPEDTPSAAEFDIRGFPWDSRIHSDGRSMKKSGEWRYKRGVTEMQINAVEMELQTAGRNRQATPAPAAIAVPVVPPPPTTVATPPAVAVQGVNPLTIAQLLMQRMALGTISDQALREGLAQCGVQPPELYQLMQAPQAAAIVAKHFGLA